MTARSFGPKKIMKVNELRYMTATTHLVLIDGKHGVSEFLLL